MEKQIHDFVVKCEKRRIFATELFDRMSVACISYWYGLTLPALRVRYIPDLRDRVMPRTFII